MDTEEGGWENIRSIWDVGLASNEKIRWVDKVRNDEVLRRIGGREKNPKGDIK